MTSPQSVDLLELFQPASCPLKGAGRVNSLLLCENLMAPCWEAQELPGLLEFRTWRVHEGTWIQDTSMLSGTNVACLDLTRSMPAFAPASWQAIASWSQHTGHDHAWPPSIQPNCEIWLPADLVWDTLDSMIGLEANLKWNILWSKG